MTPLRGDGSVPNGLPVSDKASTAGQKCSRPPDQSPGQLPHAVLVQNDKYAISMPVGRQSVAPTLAHKGIGYGVPAVLVDGNDVVALMAVLGEAVERAVSGDGPTLVEADTYRVGAHTNADGATRYRTEDEVAHWAPRDPLLRLRFGRSTSDLGALFTSVYAKPTPQLAAQAESLRAELEVTL